MEIEISYGEAAPSTRTVYRWLTWFKEEGEHLEAKPLDAKLILEIIEEALSYNEIEAETSLNHWAINEILHEHFKLRKIRSRWVAHEFTQKQKTCLNLQSEISRVKRK